MPSPSASPRGARDARASARHAAASARALLEHDVLARAHRLERERLVRVVRHRGSATPHAALRARREQPVEAVELGERRGGTSARPLAATSSRITARRAGDGSHSARTRSAAPDAAIAAAWCVMICPQPTIATPAGSANVEARGALAAPTREARHVIEVKDEHTRRIQKILRKLLDFGPHW